eukprot:3646213-Ditylum_brightwellii.AAC.1
MQDELSVAMSEVGSLECHCFLFGTEMMDLSSSGNGAGTTFVVGKENRTDPAVAGGAGGVHLGLVFKEHGGHVGVMAVGAATFLYGTCWYEDRIRQNWDIFILQKMSMAMWSWKLDYLGGIGIFFWR